MTSLRSRVYGRRRESFCAAPACAHAPSESSEPPTAAPSSPNLTNECKHHPPWPRIVCNRGAECNLQELLLRMISYMDPEIKTGGFRSEERRGGQECGGTCRTRW